MHSGNVNNRREKKEVEKKDEREKDVVLANKSEDGFVIS